jgi:hypothetical protein
MAAMAAMVATERWPVVAEPLARQWLAVKPEASTQPAGFG